MQTRPLHPPRVRSIWVESGSQSLGDSQPMIVPSSYLETSHTQHSLMLEEPQPSIVNGLSWGGEACFQSVLPAILPPPPLGINTLGEPEAKIQEAAVAPCPGVLGKAYLYFHTWNGSLFADSHHLKDIFVVWFPLRNRCHQHRMRETYKELWTSLLNEKVNEGRQHNQKRGKLKSEIIYEQNNFPAKSVLAVYSKRWRGMFVIRSSCDRWRLAVSLQPEVSGFALLDLGQHEARSQRWHTCWRPAFCDSKLSSGKDSDGFHHCDTT